MTTTGATRGGLPADPDARRAHILPDEYRAKLVDGTTLRNAAASHRSRRSDWVVCDRRSWSHAIEWVAKMGAASDPLAQIAAAITTANVPLYQTRHEAAAKIFEAAAKAVADGYTDVIRLAGPDAGRRRDAQRPYTLAELVEVTYYLAEATSKLDDTVPGVGWCVDAIRDELRVRVPTFPSFAGGR